MDDDITNKINNNIYNLAFLEIGLLSETLDYLRPDFSFLYPPYDQSPFRIKTKWITVFPATF